MTPENIASEDSTPESRQLAQSAATKYRLLAELGRGGMSDVYLALMTGAVGFSKLVVLKRLEPALAKDAEFMHMFLDEARLMARLNHPNVVQTYEVGYAEARYFIAMEYLEGQPLNRILRQTLSAGGLSLAAQLRIVSDALNGLHYAHELRDFDGSPLGVVHRDVSPQNVFVTYAGQVKVVDFGVAKAVTRSSDNSGGMIRGKIAYMAPEQARAESVDRRADVFSMGVILWEIAARRRMWKGKNVPQILTDLVAGRIPELIPVVPEVPPELQAICARATAAHPDLRFESAAEFRSELEVAIERLGPKSANDVGSRLSEMFAKQRLQVRTLIEIQLGHLRLGSNAGSTEPEGELPRLDDSEPPSSTPLGERGAESTLHSNAIPPSLEPTAYGIHWQSVPPPELAPKSPLQRRSAAVLAVTAVLALIGVVSLLSVVPRASEPPSRQLAANPPAHPAPPSPPLAAPVARVAERPDPLLAPAEEAPRRPSRAEPLPRRRAYRAELEPHSEGLIAPVRRQKRALDKDDPWK